MKPLPREHILGVLGLIFAIVPWFWPQAATLEKAIATMTIVWLTLTIYLVIFDRLDVAWPLFSLGLVVALGALFYFYLPGLNPPRTSRAIIVGLLMLSLSGILIFVCQKTLRSPFLPSIYLAQLGSLEQLDNFVQDAAEIFLCGLTLGGLINRYSSIIESLMKQECRLRVLLPQEDVLLSCAHRISLDYEPQTRLNEEYQATLAWLDRLAKDSNGAVQIRTTYILPTISLMIVNPGSPRARVRVALHVFEGALNKRPYFEFSRHKQPKWYDFFAQRYYNNLWDRAIPREVGSKGELHRAAKRLQQRKNQ